MIFVAPAGYRFSANASLTDCIAVKKTRLPPQRTQISIKNGESSLFGIVRLKCLTWEPSIDIHPGQSVYQRTRFNLQIGDIVTFQQTALESLCQKVAH